MYGADRIRSPRNCGQNVFQQPCQRLLNTSVADLQAEVKKIA